MKVAIYIRVSTDMQADDGFSIEGQRQRLSNFAKSQDWIVFDEYIDDGYSAKDLERPEMQRLLQDMEEKKFEVILVYKLDRLTRSVGDLHGLLKTFDKCGVKFKSATEIFETTTAMGRFFITLVGAMAEWERGTISERVRFGIEQMVREGKRPGGIIPYGYTQDEILIPEEAAIIREVRSLYHSGLGYKSIAIRLNREGKLRRGNEWTSATVSYTLENPYYAGIIRLGSKTPEGNYVNSKRDERVDCIYGQGSHEPIFTNEEYEETKTLMERRTSGGFSRNKAYWFSGVLRCGRCGAAMFGRLTTKRSLKSGDTIRTQYYTCSNKHANNSCDMPMFRQVHVEHLVMSYIREIQIDTELILNETKNFVAEKSGSEDAIQSAKRELLKVLGRKEKWQYMFVEGLISKEDVRKRIMEEEKIEQELKQKIAVNKNNSSGLPKLEALVELEELWGASDDSEKKDLIYTIFNKITVNTHLSKVKGVKNKFFDAYIDEVSFN
ncbi:MAG: recombinase family protein [Bacillota bacterium]